ncbi:sulfatase-like hydrolase/transferase [Novosphingobium pentaromativorans]|nr:sulfatase-like hydrolase/transferase [Novosphingobium pentaromativorans]
MHRSTPQAAMLLGQRALQFHMFRHFSPSFAFWWVILPNIGAIAMWPIGGPSAAFSMAVCGILALLFCQFKSAAIRQIGIVACFALSIMMYVTATFNLTPFKAVSSMKFLAEVDLASSPEYVLAFIVIVVALLLALRFAPRTPRLLSKEERVMAILAVALLINMDSIATAGTRGSYKMHAPEGTPIDSAVLQNRIEPQSVHARNMIVILVESLGAPNNAHDRALFERAWGRERWSAKYQVSQGKTAYYGSTTNGALRELCAVWSDYDRFDFDKTACLPKKFVKAGFHTTAIHAFYGEFFERDAWYPKLGFEDRLFRSDLLARNVGACGGVFEGACDSDIPALIGDRLRKARGKRNFVYWVTLNTHLPIAEDPSLHTENCSLSDPAWNTSFPMLCREYLLQQRLADALVKEVMRPDFPESDILIVGDHMPPFFPRDMRDRYDTRHVPWIMLRNRAALERYRSEGPKRLSAAIAASTSQPVSR